MCLVAHSPPTCTTFWPPQVFTDREDVPAFVKAPHAKPSDYVVGVVAASYADVQPLVVSTPPAQAFDAALAAAKAMPRWEVVHEDREGGVIEAVATTAIMRFRDDVVIRCVS